MGHAHVRLAPLTFGHVGGNVGWVACGWVGQHEPAGQGHLEAPVVRFVSFAVGLLEVGASVLGCLGQKEDSLLDGVVDVAVHELFF